MKKCYFSAKHIIAVLLACFAFAAFGAQTSPKKTVPPAQKKAEIRAGLQKSASKNDFGDVTIPMPKVDAEQFQKMNMHGAHGAFLNILDPNLNLNLLEEISKDSEKIRKASQKENGLALIDLYLKNWNIGLKKVKRGQFKPAEIQNRLNLGQPILAYVTIGNFQELMSDRERAEARSSCANPGEWSRKMKNFKRIERGPNRSIGNRFLIVGFNAKTGEYCVSYFLEKTHWISEAELQSLMIDMYFADL